uniref:Transmembrane protein n=1 Tax=Schistosoma mansoni TaxID=6183 RepID=A0A3Q0KNT6_SCHMA
MLIIVIISSIVYINCIVISNNGSYQFQSQKQTFNANGYSMHEQNQSQSFIHNNNDGQHIIQKQSQQQSQHSYSIQSQIQYQSLNYTNLQSLVNPQNQNDDSQIPVDTTNQSSGSQISNQAESPSQSGTDIDPSLPDNHQQQQQATELPQESQDSQQQQQQQQPTQETQNEADSPHLELSPQFDQSHSNNSNSILVQPQSSEQSQELQDNQDQSSQQLQSEIQQPHQLDLSPQFDQSQSNISDLILVQLNSSKQSREIQDNQDQSLPQLQPEIQQPHQIDLSSQFDQSQSNISDLILVQLNSSKQSREIQDSLNQSLPQLQPEIQQPHQIDLSSQFDQSQSNISDLILVQPQPPGQFQESDSQILNVSKPVVESYSEFDDSQTGEPKQSLEAQLTPDPPLSYQNSNNNND